MRSGTDNRPRERSRIGKLLDVVLKSIILYVGVRIVLNRTCRCLCS